jgi:hypothetical protein
MTAPPGDGIAKENLIHQKGLLIQTPLYALLLPMIQAIINLSTTKLVGTQY